MSGHHHSNSIQHLYEGDQSKLYSGVLAHHTDINSGRKQVAGKEDLESILDTLVITVAEVIVGMYFSHSLPKALVVFFFLALTVLKSGYIVSVFMHLGDEFKGFIITVLVPLFLFIWFIIAFLADGGFWLKMNNESPSRQSIQHHATK